MRWLGSWSANAMFPAQGQDRKKSGGGTEWGREEVEDCRAGEIQRVVGKRREFYLQLQEHAAGCRSSAGWAAESCNNRLRCNLLPDSIHTP